MLCGKPLLLVFVMAGDGGAAAAIAAAFINAANSAVSYLLQSFYS
jgi:hypothetical protein